jgi:hypothetical protein
VICITTDAAYLIIVVRYVPDTSRVVGSLSRVRDVVLRPAEHVSHDILRVRELHGRVRRGRIAVHVRVQRAAEAAPAPTSRMRIPPETVSPAATARGWSVSAAPCFSRMSVVALIPPGR